MTPSLHPSPPSSSSTFSSVSGLSEGRGDLQFSLELPRSRSMTLRGDGGPGSSKLLRGVSVLTPLPSRVLQQQKTCVIFDLKYGVTTLVFNVIYWCYMLYASPFRMSAKTQGTHAKLSDMTCVQLIVFYIMLVLKLLMLVGLQPF